MLYTGFIPAIYWTWLHKNSRYTLAWCNHMQLLTCALPKATFWHSLLMSCLQESYSSGSRRMSSDCRDSGRIKWIYRKHRNFRVSEEKFNISERDKTIRTRAQKLFNILNWTSALITVTPVMIKKYTSFTHFCSSDYFSLINAKVFERF